MGTNFYAQAKITKKQRENAKQLLNEAMKMIDNNDIICHNDNVIDNLSYDLREALSTEIHLGKRSYGWQFLWNFNNGKYYAKTLASIKEFLKDKTIYDEYDNIYTLDQFFNDEIGHCLYKTNELLDGSEGEYHDQYTYNDGLRFSVTDCFS